MERSKANETSRKDLCCDNGGNYCGGYKHFRERYADICQNADGKDNYAGC